MTASVTSSAIDCSVAAAAYTTPPTHAAANAVTSRLSSLYLRRLEPTSFLLAKNSFFHHISYR